MTVRFGAFALHRAKRELTRGGLGVHVTPKAFDLLELLLGEAPRVVDVFARRALSAGRA